MQNWFKKVQETDFPHVLLEGWNGYLTDELKEYYSRRTASSISNRQYKVFYDSFADAFQMMEGISLSETDALEAWARHQQSIEEMPDFAEEMEQDFLPDTIYGRGEHRYLVKGNGDVFFSSLHADPFGVKKAKRLGFQII